VISHMLVLIKFVEKQRFILKKISVIMDLILYLKIPSYKIEKIVHLISIVKK